jgi:predicted helicase
VNIGERQPKWLNDDYVKFIRFSQWKIERNGSGILAFITNHNYLSAPTFRAMRAALLNTFDDIYVLNLNGSTKRKDKAPDGTLDQNVFDIQQGVAIALFVRRGDELTDGSKRVSYYSLRGPRVTNEDSHALGKYEWLDEHTVENTEWQSIDPVAPYFLFVPRDKEIEAEYKKEFP